MEVIAVDLKSENNTVLLVNALVNLNYPLLLFLPMPSAQPKILLAGQKTFG